MEKKDLAVLPDRAVAAAAHTPGPWKPVKHGTGDYDINTPEGDIACVYITDGGDEPNWFDAEANARLIAASPTMAKALKPFADFMDALEMMGGNTPKTGAFYTLNAYSVGERSITIEDFKAARAAISKALGTAADTAGPVGPQTSEASNV